MIFLSYARQDGEESVMRLEQDLEENGWRTWRDKRGIDPTQDFTVEIEKAIQQSSHIVVCLTPDVRRDDSFVRREIVYGQLLRKPIIVARYSDVTPPISVVTHTWIDFFKLPYEAALNSLVTWLYHSASAPHSDPHSPEDKFRGYLETLYTDIVHYIDRTVLSKVLELRTQPSPSAVVPDHRAIGHAMPAIVFNMAGIAPSTTSSVATPIDNFATAFEQYKGRVLLLGAPGAGKTTTLMSFARDMVARRLEDPTCQLPIYTAAVTWNPYTHLNPLAWLKDTVPLLRNQIEGLINSGKVLLLVDGLDELGTAKPLNPAQMSSPSFDPRMQFIETIVNPLAKWQTPDGMMNSLIVTSRDKDYESLEMKVALTGAVKLEPLANEQISAYLAELPELWTSLQADPKLMELCRTPLLLSLLAVGFDRGSVLERNADNPEVSGFKSNEFRDQILMNFVRQRYQHEVRKPNARHFLALEDIVTGLGVVAADNVAGGRREYLGQSSWIQENVVTRTDFERLNGDPNALICDALELNFLIPIGEDTLRFAHLLFRDALAFNYSMTAANSTDLVAVRRAIEAFAGLRDARAAKPLLGILAQHESATTNLVVGSLVRLGEGSIAPLVEFMLSSDETGCERAALALSGIGDAAIPAIKPLLLRNRKREIRRSAVTILGNIGGAKVVGPLIRALRDTDSVVRDRAAGFLGASEDPRAIPPLIQRLNDSERRVRNSAIRSLVEIGEPAVEPLIEFLAENPRDSVRGAVANALGRIGSPLAVESLVSMLEFEVWDVANEAQKALIRIGTDEAWAAVKSWRWENDLDE